MSRASSDVNSNASEPPESVSVVALDGRLGRAEFADYLAALDRCLEGLRPFAMIVDGSALELGFDDLPGRQWHRIRATRITAFHRGVVFVTGADMSRERVRSLCALQPPGVPYAFVQDRKEAMEWARAQLEGSEQKAERKTVSIMAVS